MSHNRDHIIIQSLTALPDLSAQVKAKLTAIAERIEANGECSFRDKWRVCRIVWRLLSE